MSEADETYGEGQAALEGGSGGGSKGPVQRRGRPRKASRKAGTKPGQPDEGGRAGPGADEVPESFSATPDEPSPVPGEDAGGGGQDTARNKDAAGEDREHMQDTGGGEGTGRGADAPEPEERNGPGPHHRGGLPQRGGGPAYSGKGRKGKKKGKFPPSGGGRPFQKKGKGGGGRPRAQWQLPGGFAAASDTEVRGPDWGELAQWEELASLEGLRALCKRVFDEEVEPYELERLYRMSLPELEAEAEAMGIERSGPPERVKLIDELLNAAQGQRRPVHVTGVLEISEDGFGFLVYGVDNYRPRELSTFVPEVFIREHGWQRGHLVEGLAHAPRAGESCPFLVRADAVNGQAPDAVSHLVPFTELTPYYPTQRILLETSKDAAWDNISMRVVDLLSPVGLGQRGLIVAPPRVGKTVLLQGIANAVMTNKPEAHLIVLLVDERPEEVTDFKQQVKKGEVVSSTFDESAESHVHAAEMVIEKARRMVEAGRDVIILLDSITRLARAYNTLMPSSGKILSGGVEATALQKPKRFFGSARNIEGGGSLTILGTALIETGSRMDEVIFEEFKGTGNMELHLDRELANKRIFPALSFERSGTRKEELLYHPDEMNKIYSLRRAMKGVPSVEAMEMLIQRVKKTRSNAEFLMAMNR